MLNETDRQFACYRETGDSEALAAVFDATAPGLLLLAIHLTKDEVGAEDLVQLTFLKAIEHADSYDPSRPFLPWASTLLANEVRQQWRRRQRRAPAGVGDGGRSASVEQLAGTRSSDPHRVASEAETLHTVVGAIDDLEPAYRSAVRLKVVHGMKPGEIAKVLQLSPEVARTRISRGLKQLRARLPEGVAGALALTLGGRGMAQVRSAVLSRSRTLEQGGSGASTVSLTSAWPVLLVGLFLSGLAVLWWEFEAGSGLSEPRRLPVAADGVAQSPTTNQTAEGLLSRQGLPTTEVGSAVSRPTWSLEGVVSSAGGGPLVGASVGVSWIRGCEVRQLPVVVTDAAGRYETSLDGLRDLGVLGLIDTAVQIDVTALGHQPRSTTVAESTPTELVPDWRAREDLVLTPGPVVRARLLAPSGEPARGWALGRVISDDRSPPPSWLETDSRAREPGEALDPSRLVLPVSGSAPYRLEVTGADGLAFVTLDSLPRDGDLGDVRLSAFGEVVGRIVTESGVPVPYSRVRVEHSTSTPAERPGRPAWRNGRVELVRAAVARTNAAGVFRAHGLEPGVYRVRLIDTFGGTARDTISSGEALRDIHVPGQVVRVRTVDDEGRTVPGTTLRCEWTLGGVRHTERIAIQDVPGRFDLLVPFGSKWRMTSGDPRVSAEPLSYTSSPREPEVDLEMVVRSNTERGRLQLSVLTTDGEAVRGFALEAHHLSTDFFLDSIEADELNARALPAGRYVVVVRPMGSAVDPTSAFLPAEIDLEISPGESNQASVTVQRAGVVDVALIGRPVGETIGLRLERREDGDWLPAGVLEATGGDIAGVTRLRSTMPFEPGSYVLRVVGPTDASAPVTAFVVAGKVSLLQTRLLPR